VYSSKEPKELVNDRKKCDFNFGLLCAFRCISWQLKIKSNVWEMSDEVFHCCHNSKTATTNKKSKITIDRKMLFD